MAGKGMGGHQKAKGKSQIWLTPPELIRPLGKFDLDPCAAPNPRPFETADSYYTLPDVDGLKMPWFGRVWLNAPYETSVIGKWMRKLSTHGRGTALCFARTDTTWFFDTIFEEADALLFLRGRVHFYLPDGTRAKMNGGAPSVLVAYGAEDAERLIEAKLANELDGHIVANNRPVMIHLSLQRNVPIPTWKSIVLETIKELGGEAGLQELYKALAEHPKAQANPHFRAKIRQTLARANEDVERVEEGRYAISGM